MKLDFYNVDKKYIAFMQAAEIQKRGFTRIPNMDYEGRKQKFLCGIILTAPKTSLNYFVGITHYSVQRSENFLIRVENDIRPVKGSLRFNYMFPVPLEAVSKISIAQEADARYRILLSKELKAINNAAQIIIDKANSVYHKVTNKQCSQNLLLNSCDFTYLEEKCLEYEKTHGYGQPEKPAETIEEENTEAERTPFNDLLVKLKAQKKAEHKAEEPER